MTSTSSINTLNQWVGNYNQTTYSPWVQPPTLSIQDNGSGILQVLLDGNLINNPSYDSSNNQLSWTGTNGNWSAATLTFTNNNYQLILQQDGNLVLTDAVGTILWSTGTSGQGVVQALMQTDGNFVLYNQVQPTNQPGSPSDAVWSTGTHGNSGAYLSLANNGTLAILSSTGSTLKTLYSGNGTSSSNSSLLETLLESQQELLSTIALNNSLFVGTSSFSGTLEVGINDSEINNASGSFLGELADFSLSYWADFYEFNASDSATVLEVIDNNGSFQIILSGSLVFEDWSYNPGINNLTGSWGQPTASSAQVNISITFFSYPDGSNGCTGTFTEIYQDGTSTTTTLSGQNTSSAIAAQNFLKALLTNPSFALTFEQEVQSIYSASTSITQANQQMNSWLNAQGYATNPNIIYQALIQMANTQLVTWTELYGNTFIQQTGPTLSLSGTSLTINQTSIQSPTFSTDTQGNPTVTWTIGNGNTTAGNLVFSQNYSSFQGNLQINATSPAYLLTGSLDSFAGSSSIVTSGQNNTYTTTLDGFAPVLAIIIDSDSDAIPQLCGVPLQNYTFSDSTLSWGFNGNSTAGQITFYYTSPFSLNSTPPSYVGPWFQGTLQFSANSPSFNYQGSVGNPVSFPLTNWTGNYGATALSTSSSSTLNQGPTLVIQSNGQSGIEILLNGTFINNWSYNCAYNLLTWITNDNATAAYLSFSSVNPTAQSSYAGPGFQGNLTQNGTTQNFSGILSNPSQLSDWIGIYGQAFLIPSSSTTAIAGPCLEIYLINNNPTVTLNFGNNQIATLPTSTYDQQTNTLTWSSSTGVNTSGSVAFVQQQSPTAQNSYVGNLFAGTLTIPDAVGSFSVGTYQYNGELGQPNTTPPSASKTPTWKAIIDDIKQAADDIVNLYFKYQNLRFYYDFGMELAEKNAAADAEDLANAEIDLADAIPDADTVFADMGPSINPSSPPTAKTPNQGNDPQTNPEASTSSADSSSQTIPDEQVKSSEPLPEESTSSQSTSSAGTESSGEVDDGIDDPEEVDEPFEADMPVDPPITTTTDTTTDVTTDVTADVTADVVADVEVIVIF